jgi:hypothetical protein
MFVLKGELDLASLPMFEAAIADAVLAGVRSSWTCPE